MNYRLDVANWGSTEVTGRGLMALVGSGSISEITLNEGEAYTVLPSHLVGYSMNAQSPTPYRFKSSSLRLQVPNVLSLLPDTRFFRVMRESETWRTIGKIWFTLRTWARRTIWGDRLFLQIYGPTTILLQTRAAVIADAFTAQDVEELADTEPGAVDSLTNTKARSGANTENRDIPQIVTQKAPEMHMASVGKDGKVTIGPVDGSKSSP